jgi:hypothetical protein
VAGAEYAIVNGIGYDVWAPKLLSASQGSGRIDLNVGDLVGIKTGGNPHRWYSRADVRKVIERITTDYQKVDPADAEYFEQQKNTLETTTLAPYDQLISNIKASTRARRSAPRWPGSPRRGRCAGGTRRPGAGRPPGDRDAERTRSARLLPPLS